MAARAFALLVTLAPGCGPGGEPVAPGSGMAAPVAHIQFSTQADTLIPGQARVLQLRLVDDRGRQVTGRAVQWESSSPEVATVDSAGVLLALTPGATIVRATSEGRTASLPIMVRALPVAMLRIAPLAEILTPGRTAVLQVEAFDAHGSVVPDPSPSYSVSSPTIISVSPSGVITGLSAGTATLEARADGQVARIAVTVLPTPPAVLAVSPAARVLAPGRSLQIRAELHDAAGAPLDARGVRGTFSSSDPSIARVDGAGVVTAVAPGTVQLLTAVGSLSAMTTIVVEEPPAGAFDIEIVPVGSMEPAVVVMLERAAARWERVITGDLPAQRVSLPAGQCAAGAPAIDRTIDDVAIIVEIDSIDGRSGTLGMAGPCMFRDGGARLPVLGIVTLDRDDVAVLMEAGTAEDLVAHEIGHVLGVGTVWSWVGVHELVTGSADPRFVGRSAMDAAGRLGYADDATAGVRVETAGGGGTAGSHWRESGFGSELMTGWLSHGRNPLSAITVGALRDLGYEVHEAHAEDFGAFRILEPMVSMPGTGLSTQRLARSGPPLQIREVLVAPRYRVDHEGRATPLEPDPRRRDGM
ncbi:MAG TPA: Ig-like domain-containing protein [Gemmatimonadales bacterium]